MLACSSLCQFSVVAEDCNGLSAYDTLFFHKRREPHDGERLIRSRDLSVISAEVHFAGIYDRCWIRIVTIRALLGQRDKSVVLCVYLLRYICTAINTIETIVLIVINPLKIQYYICRLTRLKRDYE